MGSLLSRLVLGAGVAAAMMLHGPAIVDAQPPPAPAAPSPAQKAAAKKLVDEGIAAQDAGDYDKAIDLYKRAYALVPHPILMFNIGQALRLAGRLGEAAPFYKRYLDLEPNGSQSAAAHAALADIHASTAAGSTSKPVSGPAKPGGAASGEPVKAGEAPVVTAPIVPAPVGPEAAPPTVGTTSAPVPVMEPNAPPRTDPAASPGRGLRLTGLALGGAGLASAAVGVYFTTRVLHWEAEAEKEGPPFTSSKSKGEAAQLRGDIAYGLAGALVIGGAVTYWLGHRRDQEAHAAAWVPVVGAGYAGIAFSGSLR